MLLLQNVTHGRSWRVVSWDFLNVKKIACLRASTVKVLRSKISRTRLIRFQKYLGIMNLASLGGFVADGGWHVTSARAYLLQILVQVQLHAFLVSMQFTWHVYHNKGPNTKALGAWSWFEVIKVVCICFCCIGSLGLKTISDHVFLKSESPWFLFAWK